MAIVPLGDKSLQDTATAAPPGVPLADLPRQIQALVLCTAAARVMGRPDGEVRPTVTGYCHLADVVLHVNEFGARGSEDTPVAGRPADIDSGRVQVELLRLPTGFPDRHVVLDLVTRTDAKALAERLLTEVG